MIKAGLLTLPHAFLPPSTPQPKDLAKAAAASEAKDAPPSGDATQKEGKKRRRTHRKNRHIPVDKSQLSLEERERRRQQREARERALSVRAKGQKYRPLRVQRMRDDARERKGIERLPRRAPQVIVLPIFWKERTEGERSRGTERLSSVHGRTRVMLLLELTLS